MSRLPEDFNWGKELATDNPNLYRQLSQVYSENSRATNRKSNKTVSPNPQIPGDTANDPPANSTFNAAFDIGDLYVRTDTDTAWIMTSRTSENAATWTQIT